MKLVNISSIEMLPHPLHAIDRMEKIAPNKVNELSAMKMRRINRSTDRSLCYVQSMLLMCNYNFILVDVCVCIGILKLYMPFNDFLRGKLQISVQQCGWVFEFMCIEYWMKMMSLIITTMVASNHKGILPFSFWIIRTKRLHYIITLDAIMWSVDKWNWFALHLIWHNSSIDKYRNEMWSSLERNKPVWRISQEENVTF